jgi:hypothetical protein
MSYLDGDISEAVAELGLNGQAALTASVIERLFGAYVVYARRQGVDASDMRSALDALWHVAEYQTSDRIQKTAAIWDRCAVAYPQDLGVRLDQYPASSALEGVGSFVLHISRGGTRELVYAVRSSCRAVFNFLSIGYGYLDPASLARGDVGEDHPMVRAEEARCQRDLEEITEACKAKSGLSPIGTSTSWSELLRRLRRRSEAEAESVFAGDLPFSLEHGQEKGHGGT